MNKEEIIELLNKDFVFEIEASMIYVRNSFIMKNCDSSRVTEAIAVDEMRHLNWLADLIVKREGIPTMEHKKLDFGGETLIKQLEKQLELETNAVNRYKQQIELIGDYDKEVVGVLKHILDEEKRHKKEFKIRLERLKR